MDVSLQQSQVKPGTYRVILHPGARADFEAFLSHIERRSSISGSEAMAVLHAAAEWVEQNAARGKEADLGPLGRSRLGMKGSFDDIPDKIRDEDVKLTISWILPRKLKKRVAQAGNKLVRERIAARPKAPIISDVRQILPNSEPDTVPGRYTINRGMRLYGQYLDYDTSRYDEGLFLIDAAGTEHRPLGVVSVGPKRVLFLMHQSATGEYTLEVRRRHPRTTGRLLTGRYEKPLVPA